MTAEGTRWTPKAIVCMGVSSFGGLGLAPVAPGTFGTLGGVLIAWLLSGTPNFLVSALVAALAVDALGPKRVHAVMLPYRYTSAESLTDAAACAKALGIRYDIVPIAAPVEGFTSALGDLFTEGLRVARSTPASVGAQHQRESLDEQHDGRGRRIVHRQRGNRHRLFTSRVERLS
mgnify:CR=1 FL=1